MRNVTWKSMLHSFLIPPSASNQDFVMALSILLRGTVHEKLRWTFNLYDINKDGYINKEVGLFVTDVVDFYES